MDESGDLGFDFQKERTSRYFVMGFLVVNTSKHSNKIVEKIIAEMNKKERKKHYGVFHFYQITHTLRTKILEGIAKLDCKIFTIHVDKHTSSQLFQYSTHNFYNVLTTFLLDRIFNSGLLPLNETIKFIASRRETKKILNANFIFTIEQYIKKTGLNMIVSIESPSKEK